MTFLLTGTRAPATLELARRLWREGVRVVGADSMRFPLGHFSKAFAVHRRVPSPRERREEYIAALLRLIADEGVTTLWPTCEEIFHLAAAHGELAPHVRMLCEPLALLEPLHDKLRFARLAGALAPGSWEPAESPHDRKLVWKPRYSRFAVRTRIGSPPASTEGWMAQEFVNGAEFSSWAFCVAGEVRTMTFYECLARAGRGAGCAFAPFWNEEAAAFVQGIAGRFSFTGSLAFDFIRGREGLRVIECNPRLTSGIHVLDPSIRLTDLLEAAGPMPPPMVPAQLRLPTLFSNPRAALSSPDVIAARDDGGPVVGQFLGFAELAGIALRRGIPISAAATLDIEYNGDDGDSGDLGQSPRRR